jgi:hypothetical protein
MIHPQSDFTENRRYHPAPLPEGATKPCPICNLGYWYRNVDGELVHVRCDLRLHGLE